MSGVDELTCAEGIAVIGMAGRFPKARNFEELWDLLAAGEEAISLFSAEELMAAGIDPALVANPNYVRAGGVLADIDRFDAEFFGFTPREAEITDPQVRVFLECAWEALESAGYDSDRYSGSVGVFAGSSLSRYLSMLLANPEVMDLVGSFRVQMGNDKDFLPTWVSYKLNLRGPSFGIQTACSTSLVAVHVACQSLLNYECDMALAGGVSIRFLRKSGYLYKEGGINSSDGHCRAFDAAASGTVSGDGAGVVVLKRLGDALADRDSIHAVIRGSAVNNDGGLKSGFTAPSVDGQARVIAEALALAGIAPEEIRYVEAHGTGTSLGDPIEVAALSKAFRSAGRGYCAIGSLKANIGHLDTAAGIAGLLKAIGILKRRQLPPSLHFQRPNPAIDFSNSPFYVNTQLADCELEGPPLYVGVSSFGIGGTNAHVVLSEGPTAPASEDGEGWCLLPLSARTTEALDTATADLACHLRQHPALDLRDVAYTLQVGRRAFRHRRTLVCRSVREAWQALEGRDVQTAEGEMRERPIVFLFSGQGAQHVGMAGDLYATQPGFREQVDLCAELFRPHLGLDLREILYPKAAEREQAKRLIDRTSLTQPTLFTIEYALARLWMQWGLAPGTMLGHSIGEYVAACLAGVFSLADAAALVAVRGRLMEGTPAGAMLSIPLPPEEIEPLLLQDLWLAAINGPSLTVVSGTTEAIAALEGELSGRGLRCRRLKTSNAFHSGLMEAVREPFLALLKTVELQPPAIRFVSNLTGTWITPQDAMRPGYWVEHLRRPVLFAQGLQTILGDSGGILLEVGPGSTLVTLAQRHPDCAADRVILPSLPHPRDEVSETGFLLGTLGRLWLAGRSIDWPVIHRGQRRRLPLPTYPFQRKRYWVESVPRGRSTSTSAAEVRQRRKEVAEWLYRPSWNRSVSPARLKAADGIGAERWLLLLDETGLGARLAGRLEALRQEVVTIVLGDRFAQIGESSYVLDRSQSAAYEALLRDLHATGRSPQAIVHLASLSPAGELLTSAEAFSQRQESGFFSLLWLVQALESLNHADPLRIIVVSNGLHHVIGQECLCPEKATLLGPCRVIPQEYPYLSCRNVDLIVPEPGSPQEEELLDRLIGECGRGAVEPTVAYRGRYRWVEEWVPWRGSRGSARLREKGVYLITGGLGEVGLVIAEHLARTVQARLVLTRLSAFPPRDRWDAWLAEYGEGDLVSRKIRKLRAIEQLGAEVEVASLDVADLPAMRGLLTRIETRFGTLHGVVHAAGTVGGRVFRSIAETGQEQADLQFRAKVRGVYVLEEVLRDRSLDFCLLMSSLSSVLGGLGFAAYAGANLFMDAFAELQQQKGVGSWISVNWDGWQVSERREAEAEEPTYSAIRPAEGREALDLILGLEDLARVAVSTTDLEARSARWARREPQDETGGSREPVPERAPHRGVADTIRGIWQDLLGLDQVELEDNFFKLGGDSLLATQLIAKLRQATGVAIRLRMVFETPTLAALAAVIAAARTDQTLERPPIKPAPHDRERPLSFSQQRLWFLEQLEFEVPPYNTFSAFRLAGQLDFGALAGSLTEIVRRHSALRTVFLAAEGRPFQVVAPAEEVNLPQVDLQGLPRAEREGEAERLAAAAAVQRFDLVNGPLLKATLLRLEGAESVILLAVHHIVCDGWSVGIFTREPPGPLRSSLARSPLPLA